MSAKWPTIVIAVVLVLVALLYFKVENPNSAYEIFLTELQQNCPDYEPNGVRYRECLSSLLVERENEVVAYSSDLITELRAVANPESQTARETAATNLVQLVLTWTTYRDQLCTVQADQYWGGSDQGGELNRCRLYETEKFKQLLEGTRAEWFE